MSNKKIAELVLALKGKNSFEDLEMSLKSFGVTISVSSLKKYVSSTNDKRFPSYETLDGLGEYAKQRNIKVPSTEEITAEFHGSNLSSPKRFVSMEIGHGFSVVNIPIIGLVPAGGHILAQENIEGVMPMLSLSVRDPENTFCLKVHGDSMIDIGIEDGDSVLIHSQSTAENGQTVIARIDGAVTCKRFYWIADKVKLEPASSKYKSIQSQNIEIVGVVTRINKNLD